MAMTVIKGKASNVNHGTDFSYAASKNGPVAIQDQLISLRLDNKPVLFRSRSTMPSINEGDVVVAAGSLKNGTLHALAIRNTATGASYHPPTTMVMVLAGLLVLMGIPMIAFLGLGLIFIGFGGWFLYKAYSIRQAIAAVAN